MKSLVLWAVNNPRKVIAVTILSVIIGLFQFPKVKIDTDPENMLPSDAPVRLFHHAMKKEFSVYDGIVLGITNEENKAGAFNVDTLKKVFDITNEIKLIDGVVAREIVSLSTKDNIEQEGMGSVRFNWLMETPPKTQVQADHIREEAFDHPMFDGSVVSKDGKAVAIYVPIKQKDLSYEVAQKIRKVTDRYQGDEKYYITGLPVAEDQFGVEMFKQMAISAPMAGLIIFLLMWFFFKSASLIIAPLIVAVTTVILTMGISIGLGYPVHIMSSMVPIFLMPIAVLDSIHILSEFFDRYAKIRHRKKTILFVMQELFKPMLFTSITSAVGFFSLSFSPIPPVQVFGVFVAIGIMIAWVLTLLFIPAFIMLLRKSSFKKIYKSKKFSIEKITFVDRSLQWVRKLCMEQYKAVLVITGVLIFVSAYGISLIQVNDNPVRWFNPNHPIRVADKVLNHHFSGTYEAYLVLEAKDKDGEVFIRPDMLRYIERLQAEMISSTFVGKTVSIGDIVKKVYYELLGGDKVNNVIPETKEAVAQSLISFENSHKPDDLWHMTTPDFSKSNIWIQLNSGDNKDMDKVVSLVDHYIKENPPPYDVAYRWAGLTYINVVWQNNMVGGMMKNFIGSFIIVLFIMLFLFRSPVKALISMVPLTITIVFIYSLLGYLGKDYDMPVAVLSALTLGLSIDFAIHFIQRSVELFEVNKSWRTTIEEMFRGPGRAIVRNALVVAIGFLPLLAAPLMPYKTVGFFMFMIMGVSSVATLIIIPAIISAHPTFIFKAHEKAIGCRCSQCILISLFVSFAVAYLMIGYTPLGWTPTVFVSIAIIVGFAVFCYFVSQRKICFINEEEKNDK